jgi:hypothetical protein
MGLRSTPDFVYNSGNGNVYIGGNQVLVSGDNISQLVNDAGYLTAHPTISAASSVDNSNGNVIQDITLDSNGHVTVLGSTDLDSRYYTETEIDAFNYLANVVEDTTPQLGGTLDLNGNNIEGYAFETTPTGTIVGASGWIYQSGQQVLSNGSFGTHIGDAQFTQNILRAQTTDTTLTNLTIGTQSGILLASNRTYNFTANIVGRRTNGQDNAGYKLEGLLVNDGYGTQLLGNPIKTTFYESDTSWDTQVSVTGAGAGGTDYLLVQCQGASSKNINWVAHVDMLEVGGNIDGYTEANILGGLSSDIIP